jgi:hypothetical protein
MVSATSNQSGSDSAIKAPFLSNDLRLKNSRELLHLHCQSQSKQAILLLLLVCHGLHVYR